MQINFIDSTHFQSKPLIINGKKYIPLSEYKEPVLELAFWEDELVKKLQAERVSLNTECCKVLRLISCKKTTGYMKERYKAVLRHCNQDIENLSKQIEEIKKARHEKQKQGLKY